MPQTANEQKALRDYSRDYRHSQTGWHSAEQRMAGNTKPHNPHADARMTTIQLMQGVVCVGLVLVLLFLYWQVSTPAGIAEMERLAAFIYTYLREIF